MQYHGLSPETILQSHIHEEELAFKAALSSQEKQINVQFDVLSIEFLKKMRNRGCKILHFSPCLQRIVHNLTTCIVEDKFQNFHLNPQNLARELKPTHMKKLNINMVILEMVNCEEFCQVFKDLGVEHVIYFKMDT